MVHLSFRVTLFLLPVGLTFAVNCPATDKAGSSLQSATTDGAIVSCSYLTARLCQYFPVGLPLAAN